MKYELKLRNKDGSIRLLEKDFVSGEAFMDALKFQRDGVEDGLDETEKLLAHASKVFEVKQSELIEGLEASEMYAQLLTVYYKTMGWTEKKIQQKLKEMMDWTEDED